MVRFGGSDGSLVSFPEKHKPDSHRYNISGIWDKNSLLGRRESALFSFTFWGPCLVLPSFLYDGVCGAGARGTPAWRVTGRHGDGDSCVCGRPSWRRWHG